MKKKTRKRRPLICKVPRIPQKKVDKILMGFIRKLTAKQASSEYEVSRMSMNRYYNHFRTKIYEHIEKAPRFKGEIEIDQGFFCRGIRKISKEGEQLNYNDPSWQIVKRKKRKQIEKKNIMVLGIYNRNGDVYTKIIEKANGNTLLPIIHMVIEGGSTIYTDKWGGFNELGLNSPRTIYEEKNGKLKKLYEDGYLHMPVNHSERLIGKDGSHTMGVDRFWSYSKQLLSRFNGISRRTFPLHLKECEFRYNNRKKSNEELFKILKKIV